MTEQAVTPMVRKVGHAMCAESYGSCACAGGRGASLSCQPKFDLALAALRALRPVEFGDLPEAMCIAGERAIDGSPGSYSAAHYVFATMIDAALSDDAESANAMITQAIGGGG